MPPWASNTFYFSHHSLQRIFVQNIYTINITSIYRLNSVVWIFETGLVDFYRSGFSNYCLHLYYYIHNVSADMSSGLLQVFVELGSLHGTSNHILFLIHGVACSNSLLKLREPTPIPAYNWTVQGEFLGLIMFSHHYDYYYYIWFFLPELIFQFFYLSFLIIGSHIVFISILGLLNRSL